MSNNVTRKGLAFGALVALTSSVIAGAPAQAAGELNVVPSAGTSYNTAFGSVFNLKTTFAPGYTPSSYEQLKYIVKTDANAAIEYGVGSASVANPATAQAVSTTSAAIAAGSGSPYSVTATSVNYLGLEATGTAATTSVEVTAFVDANNDGALTAGEWNTVKTVTFKKAADIVPTVTLTAPNTGDTAVSATVNWGDLNMEQIANEGVNFGYTYGTAPGTAATAQAGSFNSTTGVWEITSGITGGLTSATTVSAQAKIGTDLLGSAVTGTATARTIATITGEFPTTADAKTISGTNYVRLNKNFSVKAIVKDSATPAVGVAGVAVVAKVSTNVALSGTAGSVRSITVGGTTYTSGTSNFATVNLTSGADGYVTLDLATAGLADTNTITVVFTAQNLDATVVATQEGDLTYTVTDASAASIVATNKNTGVELTYNVKDQFDVLSSATNQRLSVTATNATTASSGFVAVTGGVAKFTVTPATDSTADVVVSSVIQTSSTDNAQNVTWTSPGTATGVANTIKVRSAAYAISAFEIDATRGINYGAWTTSGDEKQIITQVVMTDSTATGYVAPASSAAAGVMWAKVNFTGSNAGESLTVSGTDLYLSIDGATPTKGSATKIVQAASGVVYVASNTVGTKTLTLTNGTATKTVDVKFASAAVNTGTTAVATSAQATAANFAVAVAAAAQAGRSIDATVTVTDKWGNPVAGFDVTASVAGVASVNGGFSANVETDANGKATVKLTAGINDLGDAVVTFSDNDVNTSTNVTAVAKTVVFGQTDGYIDILNGKRASVTWSMAKGKRVAFYLDGVRKYNFVQTGDAELNLQFNLKKGTHNIKLVIGGQIVDDITVKITK